MKNLIAFTVTCIFIVRVFGQQDDTTFLKKYAGEGGIYIHPFKDAWQYDSLATYNFTNDQNKLKASQFPYGKWISLYQYKGKYYAYYPCDMGNSTRYFIAPGKFMEAMMDVTEFNVLSLSIKERTEASVKLKLPADNSIVDYTIKLIDKKRGIAVLYNPYSKKSENYRLLVRAEMVKKFPLIVNDCDSKAPEWKFDQIDLKELLQSK